MNRPTVALLNIIVNDTYTKESNILTLDTTIVLKTAQNFYKKHGFKETGKTGDLFGSIIYDYVKKI